MGTIVAVLLFAVRSSFRREMLFVALCFAEDDTFRVEDVG